MIATALSPDQLDALRSMLIEQRQFRMEQLAQLADPSASGPLASAHPEISGVLTTSAKRALHDVQRALWRMDDGCYGRCTDCGDSIAPERLEILPQVAQCLPCQRAQPPSRATSTGSVGARDLSREQRHH